MTGGNPTVHPPTGIVNVGLAAGAAVPGTWWLDRAAKKLYYAPLAAEAGNLARLDVVLPLTEALVIGTGTTTLVALP